MQAAPIRVLVADDSSLFRNLITRCLEATPGYQVVGRAADGRAAVALAATLKPDVITMDVDMPVMDGIAAVRRIMHQRPVPILMISALTRAGAEATFAALDAGAADFLAKAGGADAPPPAHFGAELARRLAVLVATPQRADRAAPRALKPLLDRAAHGRLDVRCAVIGASTGGPPVVTRILQALPADFALPLVIAQHMPGTFTQCFAERLDQQCAIGVRLAADGSALEPGVAYVAPGGLQTELVRGLGGKLLLRVSAGDPALRYRPCIDLTFASAVASCGRRVLGVVLTGMGDDGCAGGRELKAAGAPMWAQDAASCAVYGMPRAVIEAGLADVVLAGDAIGPNLRAAL